MNELHPTSSYCLTNIAAENDSSLITSAVQLCFIARSELRYAIYPVGEQLIIY